MHAYLHTCVHTGSPTKHQGIHIHTEQASGSDPDLPADIETQPGGQSGIQALLRAGRDIQTVAAMQAGRRRYIQADTHTDINTYRHTGTSIQTQMQSHRHTHAYIHTYIH